MNIARGLRSLLMTMRRAPARRRWTPGAARAEVPTVSMTLSRYLADWVAARVNGYTADDRSRFAEHYLICLLDRGYTW